MRALIQRTAEASVEISGRVQASIGRGLLIYLGIHRDDTAEDIAWLTKKIVEMRIFDGEDGRMSFSVRDIGGTILVVSQVTLYGTVVKGTRPDMSLNKAPKEAEVFYDDFVRALREAAALEVREGVFGADMEIKSLNSGPVTFMLDSLDRGRK